MTRQIYAVLLVGVIFSAFLFEQNEASFIKLKKIAKIALVAKALRPKKIPLPLLLPLPIPLLKENVHHAPVPIHHHTEAVVGYGYKQGHGGGYGGDFGGGYGGGYGGGFGGGYGGGDFGGGYGNGLEGGHGWW